MKKFIILLLAALMIVGLGVSCKPDPEPDAFKGTWKGTDGADEYTVVCDGFGKIKVTVSGGGEIEEREGTYKAADGYVTITCNIEPQAGLFYIYTHQVTHDDIESYIFPESWEGKYIFHQSDADPAPCVFPTDYDPEHDFMYQFTKDGNEYSAVTVGSTYKQYVASSTFIATTTTATLSETFAVYDGDYDPEEIPALLCSETTTGKFKCTEGKGDEEEPWTYKIEDCSEITETSKTKYTLTSTSLTIYSGDDEPLVLTKQ